MPPIQEITTAAAAAIGLGLSIYNTVQARRDKRPKLRIHVSFGFLSHGPELSDQKILFEVGNAWDQPVTVASLCIPLPGKRSLAFLQLDGERQMPILLTPGTSTRFRLSSEELEADTARAGISRHQKFRVMARDALGNEYLSNSISFKPTR